MSGIPAHGTGRHDLTRLDEQRAAAPETTPGQAAKSCVSVEATQLNETETGWVEAGIFIDRGGEDELAQQMLLASPAELRAVYDGLKLHYEQGIWSFRTVERNAAAAQERPAPGEAREELEAAGPARISPAAVDKAMAATLGWCPASAGPDEELARALYCDKQLGEDSKHAGHHHAHVGGSEVLWGAENDPWIRKGTRFGAAQERPAPGEPDGRRDEVLAAIDKFESDLGFTAPELTSMRIDELRGMVHCIFDGDDDPDDWDDNAKANR